MNISAIFKSSFGIAASLFLGLALAESDMYNTFKQYDTNGDGYISVQEASDQSEMLKQWKKADKNTDGQIETSEFSAFEGLPAATYVFDDEGDI